MSKKVSILDLNKAFDNRVRLGIMTMLSHSEWCDFLELKEGLELTDGNLASHIKSLEELNYIEVRKSFIGKKPNSSYRSTNLGKDEFEKHIYILRQLINNK